MTREKFLAIYPQLEKGYEPSHQVASQIGRVTLLMIIGPSGVGKTSLINRLGLHYVPSDTTRQPRPGERNGIDMHFRKDYDQVVDDIRNGRFVQIALFETGDMYATKNTSYPDSGVGVMPVMVDAVPVFRNLGFKKTLPAYITPPSYEEWMRRLKSHGLEEQKLAKRLQEAKKSLIFALHDEHMHFILNDDLAEAARQTKALLDGRVDESREQTARQAAEEILNRIN